MHRQSVGPIHPSTFSWHCPHAHANPREAAYRRQFKAKKAYLAETGEDGSRQRIGGLRCTTVLDPRSQQMGAKKRYAVWFVRAVQLGCPTKIRGGQRANPPGIDVGRTGAQGWDGMGWDGTAGLGISCESPFPRQEEGGRPESGGGVWMYRPRYIHTMADDSH